jgi:hypothetical protein
MGVYQRIKRGQLPCVRLSSRDVRVPVEALR